ncbi:hypothetical protein VTO42DRAFT_1358 [Malbranchea cinnamomea]
MAAESKSTSPPSERERERQSGSSPTVFADTSKFETESGPQTQSPPDSASQSRPESSRKQRLRKRLPIRTHHCAFCKQILLATTQDLARLPRRGGAGLDKAIILPLPSRTQEEEEEEEAMLEAEDGEGREAEAEAGAGARMREESGSRSPPRDGGSTTTTTTSDGNTPGVDKPRSENGGEKGWAQQKHYTILLSTTSLASQPTVIRRQDGFEKRFMIRCGRCRLICAYVLDRIHFPQKKGENEEGETEQDRGAEVVYILPGAVVETGEMMANTQNKVDMAEWERWEGLVGASKNG